MQMIHLTALSLPSLSLAILLQYFFVIQRPNCFFGWYAALDIFKEMLIGCLYFFTICTSTSLFAFRIIKISFARQCIPFCSLYWGNLPLLKEIMLPFMPCLTWVVNHTGILLDLVVSFLTWSMHSLWASIGKVLNSFQAFSRGFTVLYSLFSFLLISPLIFVKFCLLKSTDTVLDSLSCFHSVKSVGRWDVKKHCNWIVWQQTSPMRQR